MTRRNLMTYGIAAATLTLASAVPEHATAFTNTARIMLDTVKAVPSCLSWRISGVCFWLKCNALGECTIKTTVRISHYAPDVVVSSFHDTSTHPWVDYGIPLSTAVRSVGSSLIGLPIDSAGTFTREDRRDRNKIFRDADAIGHPLASLNFLLTGSWPTVTIPKTVRVPSIGPVEGNVGRPSVANPSTTVNLQDAASLPGVLELPGVSALPTITALPKLESILNKGSLGGLSIFCPTRTSPFVPYFHSVVDSLTWRALLSIEMLYPQSLIPGLREIGTWPLNTWGNVYPRDGNITQQHPVKAAAVLAQRVGDIVTRSGAPHVYIPLPSGQTTDINGYRTWLPPPLLERQPETGKWQMLSPVSDASCKIFGDNDTGLPASWGDGRVDSFQSYAFNLWRPYSCCRSGGQVFLGSVSF